MTVSHGRFLTKGGLGAVVTRIEGEVNRWVAHGAIDISDSNVTVVARWDSYGRIVYPSTDPSFDLAEKVDE